MSFKKLLFLPILVCCAGFALAQTEVSGTVLDPEGGPIPNANVLLFSSDTTLVHAEVANMAGEFVMDVQDPGDYLLQLRAVGFATEMRPLSVNGSPIDLGNITLAIAATELAGVEVVAEKPFIETQVDRTVVNVENSIIGQGSSAWEVMEKLPGVLVTTDDQISLRGKQGVRIMIDGKLQQISSSQLADLLRGMPASNVQKIELITNPSAKYDAEGNAGIINIVLKKNRANGWNGNANLSYGQGRYPKYNGSLNLGRKNSKSAYNFNGSYAHREAFNNLVINRKFFANDTINTEFNTDNYMLFAVDAYTARLGADYYLSPKTTLSLLGNGNLVKFNSDTHTEADITGATDSLSGGYDYTSNSDNVNYNYALSAQLQHDLDTTGQKLELNLDYASYTTDNSSVFGTTYLDYLDHPAGTKDQTGTQMGDLQLYSATLDYTYPISQKVGLEAGVKSSYVSSDNDVRFYEPVNGESVLDSSISNHFLYSENINAGYLNLRSKGDQFTWQFGLRAEQTIAKGNQLTTGEEFTRNYLQLFPSVFLNYNVSKKHNLNFSVTRRIDRPRYEQLNPFVQLIDATSYAQGNPNLEPQITYNFEVTHSWNQMLFTTAGFSLGRHNITQVLLQDFETRKTIQTVANIDYRYQYTLGITFSKRITPWWNTNTSITGFDTRYQGDLEDQTIDRGSPSFFANTTNRFTLGKTTSAELGFQYNHKNVYAVTEVRTMYGLSLGFQQQLFNKRGTLSINATDLLWTNYPSGLTTFDNVVEDWTAIRDTRVVFVSFLYKFGQGQSPRMRRNTGADEEKNRI